MVAPVGYGYADSRSLNSAPTISSSRLSGPLPVSSRTAGSTASAPIPRVSRATVVSGATVAADGQIDSGLGR
ncbi:hypothetical protein [Streptomyces canus]